MLKQDKIIPILLPYEIMIPGRIIYGVPTPDYLKKKIDVTKSLMSVRELLLLIQNKSVKINIEGGIPSKKDNKWDKLLTPMQTGTFKLSYLLTELISIMQEIGLSRKRLDEFTEKNKSRDEFVYANYRVIAELYPDKIVIRTIIVGEYTDSGPCCRP